LKLQKSWPLQRSSDAGRWDDEVFAVVQGVIGSIYEMLLQTETVNKQLGINE
jgi:hypothetical protein